MKLIPITILTGFLGAGKTTLINQILNQKKLDENIVIIINEFGDVSVDHELVVSTEEEIYQMNNGCICCVLRQDIVDMLNAILAVNEERGQVIDRILIETSGLAEPSPLAQTIIRTPELAERFSIDSIVTLVDAKNALYQLAHYEESIDQIAFADVVMITKKDQVDKAQYDAVVRKIRELNPYVGISDLDLEHVQLHDVVGLDLFDRTITGSQNLEQDLEHMEMRLHEHEHDEHEHDDHDHEEHEHHHHHSPIDAFTLRADRPLNMDRLNELMSTLIYTYGNDLMRYKGILDVDGIDEQVIFQGVNMAYMTEYGKPWKEAEKRRSLLVVIGRNLPQEELEQAFETCQIDA